MKGLQQAVNIKLWPGNGEPVKAWGKLKQDPELWDEGGDTLVFFGKAHQEPSFRIQSKLLRETKSVVLAELLVKGACQERTSKKQTHGVLHELFMDPPAKGSKIDILRYHVTTRNVFAFLLHKSLVGFTFYQILVDLNERLEEILPPPVNCAAALQSYLVAIGLVNVSNEPRAAAGLLAWSEDVRWNEGWREAFVHSVGMYEQLSHLQEIEDVSLPTKAHLERAHLELQVRIHEVEDSLSKFYFDDAHFAQEDLPHTIRQASDRFRKFLRQFYEKEYQSWPIKTGQPGLWLDRTIIDRLQRDFDALYEYNVDRNVSWDDDDENDRKRPNLLKSANSLNFGLDAEDFRMLLGVFQNFDCRLNTSNIPHPYPLLPGSIPAPAATKKSVFRGKKQDKIRESRVAHAYAEASNASRLSREYAANALVKAFVQFEKADQPGDVDPREARRERWIIIYCVLQTVAGISVDVPNLSFKGNVSYFLNARLHDLPPWSPTEKTFMDASREQSHCWTTANTWAEGHHNSWLSSKSPKSSSSDARSEHTYDSRPLSPESELYQLSLKSRSSSFAFFDSTQHTPIGELETDKVEQSSWGDSVTEMCLSPDLSLPPEYHSLPAKFAATAGISHYSTKALPVRPGKASDQNLQPQRSRR